MVKVELVYILGAAMSIEEGTITRTEGQTAWVMVRRGSMCDTCKSKNACHSLSDNTSMEAEARNTIGAKTGDRVIIKIATGSLVKISFIFYMIPVIALMAGAIIGKNYAEKLQSNTELYSVLFGLVGSILSFLIVRFLSKWLGKKKEYSPELIKILKIPKSTKKEDC